MKNINNISKQSENINEVVMLNNRQIKARFWKRHIANIVAKTLNVGNIVAMNVADSISLVSISQNDENTWAGQPAPYTEVVASIEAEKPIQKSFRFYQAGPRANRMVVTAKKDRSVSVESIDSFILDLVTDNVFQAISAN